MEVCPAQSPFRVLTLVQSFSRFLQSWANYVLMSRGQTSVPVDIYTVFPESQPHAFTVHIPHPFQQKAEYTYTPDVVTAPMPP